MISAPGRDDVHVWTADLDASADRAGHLATLLSPAEQNRAGRFRDARRRRRAIASRAILRELVARYVGEAPERIAIVSGRNGKPKLAREGWLRFSVSHAGDRALYAFASDREVGVDIERIVPGRHSEAIAQHFFSRQEQSAMSRLLPDLKTRAFFTCWSRKEAFVKATGEGFSATLESIEVYPTTAIGGWSVEDIPVGDLHTAAVAVEGGRVTVSGVFAALPAGESPPTGARAQELVIQAAGFELEREADVPAGDSLSA